MTRLARISALLSGLLPLPLLANPAYQECLYDKLQNSDSSLTVGEIKQQCAGLLQPKPASGTQSPVTEEGLDGSAFVERFAAEAQIEQRPFVVTPHKPNYLLVSSWNSPSSAPNSLPSGEEFDLDDSEIKFQISFKVPIWRNIFAQNVDAYFAYTAQSWWQLFNSDLSSPFRETNYEPEIFIRNFSNFALPGGLTLAGWSVGINHQSNGRAEPLSRSWNRLLGRLGFVFTEDITVMLRMWDRINESSSDDDNPEIEDFLGYGDVRVIWTPDESTYTAMFRQGRKKNAVELTWSYPLGKVFRFYTQYYAGYGESLIDYDRDISRFSIGIGLNDYLTNDSYK